MTNPISNPMTHLKERFSKLLNQLFNHFDHPQNRLQAKKIDATIQPHLSLDQNDNKLLREQFRMKGITLLQKDKSLLSHFPELLNAPIDVKVNEEKGQKWVICLTQQFEKDGQKLTLEGRFIRTTKSKHCIPIPNSFKLVLKNENE